jgi:hypothetical protein
MLDGHGDGKEVERLGPIGELWRPEMRLLQAVKLGANCIYGPFGLRTFNFGSLQHAYHQFSSSTTKSKVSLVLLGEPSSKFSIEHSDFLFLGDQSFGELTCWVAAQGATTLSIWWRTSGGLIGVGLEYLQWCSVRDPAKIFFRVLYSSATPPIKLKLGQQLRGGMESHLDQSLWWANQKHWAAVRSYLLHTFLKVDIIAAPFTSHCNTRIMRSQNHFVSQTCIGWIFFSEFYCADHLPSTAGDALT